MMKRILLFLFFIFTALSTQAGLFDKKPAFLPVDEAFQFSAAKSENQENVIVNWSIAEGYYLYQEKISVKLNQEETSSFDEPTFSISPEDYNDPYFGLMKIFKKPVQAIFKASQPPLKAEDVVEIAYQGCTEGFCYPPEVKEIKVADLSIAHVANTEKTSEKSTALSVRAIAAQVILQVLDQGKSLSTLLPDVQSQIKPQDLPLLQEITFGICRVLPRLENIIKKLLDKPLKGKTRIVHCLLLVGLYQLLYMRVPAHAAVDEVVNATKSLKSDSFRGLVNGVLRRFLREQEDILAVVDKHWQTLHPEWFVNKLKKAYPNWREIIEANNQKPPMWLRVNQQQNNTKTYRTLLEEQEIAAFECDNPNALRLAQPLSVSKLPNFEQGAVTVQDLNAQWSALLLEPQNDELILDACAAPGGKTTHILEMAPQAKVIALDVEAHRLKRVEENLTRLNQQATVVCGDATEPEKWLSEIGLSGASFDRILLDAPCSATGVIRRHPDIKWLRQETVKT